MHVETLIYAYLAICASMIVFNCVCIFTFKRTEKNTRKKSRDFEKQIFEQIERLRQGHDLDRKHKTYLINKLKKIGNLSAMDATMERLLPKEPEAVKSYLTAIYPVFIYLAMEYRNKDSIKAAYFLYIIKRFGILQGISFGPMIDTLLAFLHNSSLYCRENALQAIYSTGDSGCVLKAFKVIDSNEYFHHSKLLSDGLLSFTGDYNKLASALWGSFDGFSTQMKVTILNFFRFSEFGVSEKERMMQLLADQRQDDEIRFSCIRYFGKYYYEPAYPFLLDFAGSADEIRWEYAAIASSALENYPCERATEVLKKNLHSSNWYIRFNASQSLEKYGLTYTDMIDVFDGNDRYAREILQYRLDQRNAKNEEAAAT